ncbi:MAG TPA: NADH-quinone oxidoreductase subunit NuoF [Victivallales bacterium]|mgnify:CR=1 FL=1|nr:NADH-quinone oxidoreductase subunit NuoF [Victivallales bacterium]HRR27817.1 NADH-quinone oxidoreductase subunit NuoF [Victivallales bacterium]HRU01763.1 NADH-quinone oxidoreductase subunit NuoF [Victivallales bacterium]
MNKKNKNILSLLSHEFVLSEKKINPELEQELRKLRREEINRPVVFIGAATCGISAGANKIIEKFNEYKNETKIEVDFVEVGCIGLCAEEPIIDIKLPGKNRLSYGNVDPNFAVEILDSALKGEPTKKNLLGQYDEKVPNKWSGVPLLKEHSFFAPQTRWVLENCGIIDPCNIDEYIACGGYRALAKAIHSKTPLEVCNEVEKSGLRGRGGGGFPTGKKWKFALNTENNQKYMICNADEGDPGAFMDRAVIEGDPHKVLEGLIIASYAIGADKAYVYIRAEYPLAIKRLKDAISQAEEYGLLGENILDSGFNLKVKIKMGAGAFVCGEETALIHSIEGKRGMPRPRPPFPATSGLFGKPTVINNVETLANVPLVIDRGAEWFASVGTPTSKGTKVFALSGKVKRTGLVEVAMGKTIKEIIFDIGGGIANNKKFKAVQIGGPSGGCLIEKHLDLKIDYETIKDAGAMMGSGGLVVMDEDNCMVDVAKFFMDFIQRESCGKCIPCREGTKQMLAILEKITSADDLKDGKATLERFKGIMTLSKLANVIQDTSLCGLGQTAPNPVLSTLKWFRNEYDAHVYERRCPAGVCRGLIKYEIDQNKCVGCTACALKCPEKAIIGTKKAPHYIVQEKCVKCGLCIQVCKFGAVKVN